jgi:hypothetical protein
MSSRGHGSRTANQCMIEDLTLFTLRLPCTVLDRGPLTPDDGQGGSQDPLTSL